MAKELTSEEIILDQQVKLEWNTPEVEIFSVKDTTLAGGPGATDGGVLS